jgi:hypothetical protein
MFLLDLNPVFGELLSLLVSLLCNDNGSKFLFSLAVSA